jgi:hypothetical protein
VLAIEAISLFLTSKTKPKYVRTSSIALYGGA